MVIGNEAALSYFRIFTSKPYPGKKAYFNSIMKNWILNGDTLFKADEVKEGECPY